MSENNNVENSVDTAAHEYDVLIGGEKRGFGWRGTKQHRDQERVTEKDLLERIAKFKTSILKREVQILSVARTGWGIRYTRRFDLNVPDKKGKHRFTKQYLLIRGRDFPETVIEDLQRY